MTETEYPTQTCPRCGVIVSQRRRLREDGCTACDPHLECPEGSACRPDPLPPSPLRASRQSARARANANRWLVAHGFLPYEPDPVLEATRDEREGRP